METKSHQRAKAKQKKERDEDKAKRCYDCGKPGHVRKHCRQAIQAEPTGTAQPILDDGAKYVKIPEFPYPTSAASEKLVTRPNGDVVWTCMVKAIKPKGGHKHEQATITYRQNQEGRIKRHDTGRLCHRWKLRLWLFPTIGGPTCCIPQ
jgi:hypothetical protein